MKHYDLCVVGSGTGNALLDESLAGLSVALVDKSPRFGGTCLSAGCVPSKMFGYPADLLTATRSAGRLNIRVSPGRIDWEALQERVFGRLDAMSAAAEAERSSQDNVTLYHGEARFTGPRMLTIGGESITADRVVIATGARPRKLDIPGVDDPGLAGCIYTYDTIMRREKLPSSMMVLGGGIIAVEFAYYFASFGTKVTLMHRGAQLLDHEDEAVAELFTGLMADKVTLRLNQQVVVFEPNDRGGIIVGTEDIDGIEYSYDVECVLVAIGRQPNSDTLDPGSGGIAVQDNGLIVVDEYLRTSDPRVFAMGDVCSQWPFQHVAAAQARVVRHNLLHPESLRTWDHRFVPHAVFADPQIASVGLNESLAREQGLDYVTVTQKFDSVAYGWAMDDRIGFVKLLAERQTMKLLGAHIIGAQAALLIQPLIQGMSLGQRTDELAEGQYWIHPSLAEVVEAALVAVGAACGRRTSVRSSRRSRLFRQRP